MEDSLLIPVTAKQAENMGRVFTEAYDTQDPPPFPCADVRGSFVNASIVRMKRQKAEVEVLLGDKADPMLLSSACAPTEEVVVLMS